MDTLIAVVGVVVLFVVLVAGAALLSGFVIWALWNWVIVAFGGPHIGFWLAVGVGLVLSVIRSYITNTSTSK